jgi:glycosyltransferase involved in cell wall biosynthesis
VIYDVIDDWFRSKMAEPMPLPIRLPRMWAERTRARRADAIVNPNVAQNPGLERRWGLDRPIVGVPNYPISPPPSAMGQDLIRHHLGLPPSTRIVLYQGRIGGPEPLTVLEEATLLLPDACLVVIGFGGGWDRLHERDEDPRFKGRHFTLPARHPDELLAWTASADVALSRLRVTNWNERLHAPNKFWEALSVGTPVVVGAGQGPMARLVERYGLGAVTHEITPAAVAAAISGVIDLPPGELEARRNRIAAHARSAWSWPVAERSYLDLVQSLREQAARRSARR